MNKVYLYHLFFWLVYYLYVQNNPSDSKRYFDVSSGFTGGWFELYGTSTTFVNFLAYPFTNLLSFPYEAAMMLFGWLGYLGFIFTYLFFRENIPVKVKLFNRFDFLTLLLFLPNMHFWTTSLAKGSAIFLGIMAFIYALKAPKQRWVLLTFGALLTYHIRPHVFMFLVVGAGLGFMSGNKKIAVWQKVGAFVVMILFLIIIQDSVLAMVNVQESENLVEGFEEFSTNRSQSLSEGAGSGVQLANYPLPIKFFTFWYRPLFFDAPGVMGLIVSVENFLYLLITFQIFKKDFFKFLKKSHPLVKTSFVVFITTSFAMTFVMSNLGIIMRQKSMVMYFLFFVVFYYLGQKKYDRILRMRKLRERQKENYTTVTPTPGVAKF